jgi:hypothetical protein
MAITNGYATLAQIKAATRITDAVDDSLLEMAVESASRMIDAECDRNFYSSGTATRDFVPNDSHVVDTDDLTSIVSVKLDDQGDGTFIIDLPASQYQREPVNQRVSGNLFPIYRLRMTGDFLLPIWGRQATVRIEGVYGFTPTPIQITQATVIQSSRIYKRLDSPLGVAGFGDMGAIRVGRVDPDVAHHLRHGVCTIRRRRVRVLGHGDCGPGRRAQRAKQTRRLRIAERERQRENCD